MKWAFIASCTLALLIGGIYLTSSRGIDETAGNDASPSIVEKQVSNVAPTVKAPASQPVREKVPTLTADVDGEVYLSVAYNNLPHSDLYIVNAASGQRTPHTTNVEKYGAVEGELVSTPPGDYFLVAVDASGTEVARSNIFHVGRKGGN
jgi:hypothetical protein